MVVVERDHKDYLVQTPLPWGDTLDNGAQTLIHPGLECFPGWSIHNFSELPILELLHSHTKDFFSVYLI